MHRLLRLGLLIALLATSVMSRASFHLFSIEEIYSNADGTIQYMVLRGFSDSQQFLTGQVLLASSGAISKTFRFDHDLPSGSTNGKAFLIATQGFAALGLVAPDYVVPNGFFPTTNGMVNYTGFRTWSYAALPTDGINALMANGMPGPNIATNFAGASASVAPAAPPPVNYQGLWWKPDESGWGVNFAHQGEQIFASWFTFDTAGNAYWLTTLANRTTPGGNAYHGDIDVDVGPPFSNFTGSVNFTTVGDATITFSDVNNGTFAYNLNTGTGGATAAVSQSKPITRYVLDGSIAQPVCTYANAPNFAAATNYQDLWWVSGEGGWGINFAQQGNLIYATWYTYDAKGAGTNPPLWLTALMSRTGTTNVFSGPLVRSAGPRFDNFRTTDLVPSTTVGTASVTFVDGNNATLHYTTTGNGSLPIVDQTKSITRYLFAGPAGTTCN